MIESHDIILYPSVTIICLLWNAVSADVDNKGIFLEEKIVLFMHKMCTETEPKPWRKNRGTDRTVGYLYRCTPNW